MILLSHPHPGVVVRHTAHALQRAGVLAEFWAYVRAPSGPVLRQLAVAAAVDGEEAPDFNATDEWPDSVSPASSLSNSLDREMTGRVERGALSGVYAYADGADATFRAAGKLGLLRIYELGLHDDGGRHPILAREALREPEWAATLQRRDDDATRRRDSELRQADLIFVPSTFGLCTVEQTPGLGAIIAALAPRAVPHPAAAPSRPAKPGQLRVLFAGPLDQRSGLSYLFRACRAAGPGITLTLVGRAPAVTCRPLERELRRVRWVEPGSPEVLSREMAEHDVFVFPAVFADGTYLLLDALAMGLPVISTANSAAPDLVRDGVDGFIVPVGSADAIAERLEQLRADSELRTEMSQHAADQASRHTWEKYESVVAASVSTALARR